jgi:hypothetical protein
MHIMPYAPTPEDEANELARLAMIARRNADHLEHLQQQERLKHQSRLDACLAAWGKREVVAND